MRKGWEYKSFETCINKLPKPKQVKTSEYSSGTKYPIISQEDKLISGYYDDESYVFHIDSPVVIFGDHTRVLKYVDFDFVVGADGVKIISPKRELNAKFLLYYLQWYKIPNLGYSRHYKLLKEIKIPLPPLSTQLAIVSELDKINELIRLKKEQLKDFDNLAQSLFYEMFGDPVENEKGWEVKKLGEIGEVKTGNTPSRSNDSFYNEKFIEWIKTDNIRNEQMNPTTAAEYLSKEGAECGRIVGKGSILVACIAGSLSSIGKCCITTKNVAFNQQINAITPYGDFCNSIYLYELIRNSSKYIQQNATTGMKHILSKSIFEKLKFPLPPLPLQRLFAQRIEQIEREKSEVQKSIQDLETLLASRMQYWFE